MTFSLYLWPAMHSGAIQYGDPTIDNCNSELCAKQQYNTDKHCIELLTKLNVGWNLTQFADNSSCS